MFILGREEFLKLAERGKVVPLVYRREVGSETPFSALCKLRAASLPPRPGRGVCLLESAGGSPRLTEYSFLGLQPFAEVRFKDFTAKVWGEEKTTLLRGNPFAILRDLVVKYALPTVDLPIPFWGGAMGFLSYDIARYIERLPTWAQDDLALPEFHFIFPRVLLVFDHGRRELYISINQLVEEPRWAYEEAKEKLDWVLGRLDERAIFPEGFAVAGGDGVSNFTREGFGGVVERIKEYIRAGDVYQVNISQRLQLPFLEDPLALYQRLREINPSPFAAYLGFADFQLVSSSPERLITLRDEVAQTRPIAGTRRRGENLKEDVFLSSDLILSEKERAEHIMLVDLERNDLGRVCDYGSVKVNELMVLEKYSHVIHIVSNVVGKLYGDKDQFDLAKAMFPGGTITGCPKVRCMEIIEELEPVRRGPYTGSIGYFGFNGNMDMNIIIRTFVIKDKMAYIQAGSGVVFDSQPDREYFESLSKAEALLRALGIQKGRVEWEKLST